MDIFQFELAAPDSEEEMAAAERWYEAARQKGSRPPPGWVGQTSHEFALAVPLSDCNSDEEAMSKATRAAIYNLYFQAKPFDELFIRRPINVFIGPLSDGSLVAYGQFEFTRRNEEPVKPLYPV